MSFSTKINPIPSNKAFTFVHRTCAASYHGPGTLLARPAPRAIAGSQSSATRGRVWQPPPKAISGGEAQSCEPSAADIGLDRRCSRTTRGCSTPVDLRRRVRRRFGTATSESRPCAPSRAPVEVLVFLETDFCTASRLRSDSKSLRTRIRGASPCSTKHFDEKRKHPSSFLFVLLIFYVF